MEQELISGTREQKMFALIAEHRASTMSVKDFCALNEVAQGTYYYWVKKYEASQPSQSAVGQRSFKLLDVKPAVTASSSTLFAEYRGILFYQQPSAALLRALID